MISTMKFLPLFKFYKATWCRCEDFLCLHKPCHYGERLSILKLWTECLLITDCLCKALLCGYLNVISAIFS